MHISRTLSCLQSQKGRRGNPLDSPKKYLY
ncbi:MAG TPA: hypothetical protein HA262_16180 [Methanosarcina sp.]|nr:hypothetical protein [Methanosarcina sp.]